jgi:hypothetical protein
MPLTSNGMSSGPDDKEHRIPLVDGRERPVLELGGEHPLAVGVGDLLDLERPFQRDGVGQPVAQAVQVISR